MDPSRKRTHPTRRGPHAPRCCWPARSSTRASPPRREARTPEPAAGAAPSPGKSYELTGKVADGSGSSAATVNVFRVRDREGNESVPVAYTGAVPDPFREGREVVVTVRKQGGRCVGEKDSLVTKCPSKFQTEAPKT